MSTIAYLRFSTDSQDERSQLNIIQNYLSSKGMVIHKTYSDEGVSGGVSYTKRSLLELCTELNPNDIVVISEISRLTRNGIGELSEIVNKYFKPNSLRLIICNVGLDIDCSNINPMMELQLAMMATFAKIEKQMIIDRTQSALDVRKKKLKEEGSFLSKSGRICTHLGRPKGCTASQNAIKAAASAKRESAKANPNNLAFYRLMLVQEQEYGPIKTAEEVSRFVQKLNTLEYKTAQGMEFDVPRCRAMIKKVKSLYAA